MGVATTYVALADELETRLGGLGPGARLPSENRLAADHGVSRITTRAALQELERRHLIRRSQGSGSFVALRIPYPIRSGIPPSWSRLVTAAGHTPSYAVDSVAPLRAPAAVARKLLIGRGRTVVRLVRRGFVDGEVASHQTMWLTAGLVPGIAELVADGGSVADLLVETFGMRPDRWWSTAELLPPPADIAAQLELTGRPLAWRTETVNRCLERAVPIELAQGWMRADCFRVSLELGPVDGRPPRAEGGT